MTARAASPYREVKGGLELFIRVTPRASKDAIEGFGRSADGSPHLKARVRAVPEGGKANRALERLLATFLSIPVSDVSVTAGTSSRIKTVAVAGNVKRLIATLRVLAGEDRYPGGEDI